MCTSPFGEERERSLGRSAHGACKRDVPNCAVGKVGIRSRQRAKGKNVPPQGAFAQNALRRRKSPGSADHGTGSEQCPPSLRRDKELRGEADRRPFASTICFRLP